MVRTELEDAVYQLASLLYKDESVEEKYQLYFEEHPIVFKVLGYSNAYPKLRLPRPDGGWYEPDFLLERPDGLFEILDLKTPQEKLVTTRRKSRARFYSKIEDYISQVEEYAEYFNNSECRERVRASYSLDVQTSPEVTIIAGIDRNVSKKLLHQLLSRRTHRPHIFTYDDVLSSLQFHHATLFGHTENLSGVAWYALLTLHRDAVQKPQYIFDAGNTPSKNRWSIYIDKHSALCFEVVDSEGSSYSISVRPGMRGFHFDRTCHIICEFGNSDSFSIMRILVNNRTAAEQQFQFPISIPSDLDFTIGTDTEKQYFASFTLAACAIYKIVPNFQQRTAIFQAMLEF
jgi:hypothetical protein